MTDSSKEASVTSNIRPCDWYLDEYRHCRSYFSRFQQHFVFGKSVDCEHWNRDYCACIAVTKSQNLQDIQTNLKAILDNEAHRKEQRLNVRRENNVWNYRSQPPKDWNKPPPLWFREATKGRVSNSANFICIEYNETVTVWPIKRGTFKAFVLLTSLTNVLLLATDSCRQVKHVFTIKYKPKVGDRCLKLIYVLCKDALDNTFEDGSFQSLVTGQNSIICAIRKISFLSLIIQCFFAETLPNRRTLNLELNNDCEPIVHSLTIQRSELELTSFSEHQLWECIALELLKSKHYHKNFKFLAICSFTRCKPKLFEELNFCQLMKLSERAAALGSGGLALIAVPTLWTMPENTCDILHTLCTENGGNLLISYHSSATIGACIHEVGHIFDLGHTEFGIMSKKFTEINQFFKIGSKQNDKWWSRSSFIILSHHKWITNSNDDYSITQRGDHLESKHGILIVDYRSNNGFTLKYCEYHLPSKIVKLESRSDASCIFVMDTKGNSIKIKD